MKNNDESSYIPDEVRNFAVGLFSRFFLSIRRDFVLFREIIPYPFVWHFFSFYKIKKEDAKKLVQLWERLGFIQTIKFHGVRIKKETEQVLLQLAEEDVSYWFTCAPHKLNLEGEKKNE